MTLQNTRKELVRTWPILGRPVGSGVNASAIGASLDGRPIRAGLDAAGARHLIVPTADEDVPTPRQLDGALTVHSRQLSFDGLLTETIDIRCSRSDMFDIFDELCIAIADEITTTATAAATAITAVERWRELLRSRSSSTQLEVTEETGLFGELVVLETMLIAGFTDIDMWQGPLGSLQDFQLQEFWIEVKTTTGTPRVRIHGIDQLDETGGKAGYLAVVELSPDPHGRTVTDLVEALAEAFDRDRLEDRLLHARWSSATESARRWTIVGSTLAPVSSVPRLVPALVGGVPEGISGVDYDIAVDRVLPVSRPIADALDELRQTYESS